MSEPIREGGQRNNMNPPPSMPKPTMSPPAQGVKHSEIEKIKRQLSQLITRVDGLKQA